MGTQEAAWRASDLATPSASAGSSQGRWSFPDKARSFLARRRASGELKETLLHEPPPGEEPDEEKSTKDAQPLQDVFQFLASATSKDQDVYHFLEDGPEKQKQ